LNPRTSSQSFIIGTGEKSGPDHGFRPGAGHGDLVTGIAEVFVASTASALQMPSSSRNTACLTSRLLEHGLHHDVGLRGRAQVHGRGDARQSGLDIVGGDLALAANRSNEVRIAASPRWTAASSTSRQRDVPSGLRGHLCDARNPSDQPQ